MLRHALCRSTRVSQHRFFPTDHTTPTSARTRPVHLTDAGLLYISGHGPSLQSGTAWVTGKVGADCTTAEARQAARLTALAMLSTIESVLGTGSVFVHHGEPLRRFAVLPTYFSSLSWLNGIGPRTRTSRTPQCEILTGSVLQKRFQDSFAAFRL